MNESTTARQPSWRRQTRRWVFVASVVAVAQVGMPPPAQAGSGRADRASYGEFNQAWEAQFGTSLELREDRATGFVDPAGDATGRAPDIVSAANFALDADSPSLDGVALARSDGRTVAPSELDEAELVIWAILLKRPIGELAEGSNWNVAVHLRGGGYPDPLVPAGSPYTGTSRVLAMLSRVSGGVFQAVARFFQVTPGEEGAFPFGSFAVDFGVFVDPASALVLFVMPRNELDPPADSWRAELFLRDPAGEGADFAGGDGDVDGPDGDGLGVDAFIDMYVGVVLEAATSVEPDPTTAPTTAVTSTSTGPSPTSSPTSSPTTSVSATTGLAPTSEVLPTSPAPTSIGPTSTSEIDGSPAVVAATTSVTLPGPANSADRSSRSLAWLWLLLVVLVLAAVAVAWRRRILRRPQE